MRLFSSSAWCAGLLFLGIAFLPKQLAAQSWQWVTTPATNSAGTISITATAIDDNDNIVIVGDFTGTIQLGSTILTSAGNWDVFVARVTPAGAWLQAVQVGGADVDQATSIAIDPNSEVIVAGNFSSPALAFGSISLTNTNVAGGSSDIFVARLSAGGTWSQAASAGGAGNEFAAGAGCDQNGLVTVAGTFAGASIVAGSTTLTNIGVVGTTDIFAAQLSRTGTWSQVVGAGGAGEDIATAVAVDRNGGVAVAGAFFSPTAAFGTFTLTNASAVDPAADAFVARLGNAGWSQAVRAGGAEGEVVRAIGVDGAGNTLVVGEFTSATASFGTVSLTNADPSGNTSDLFVARLNTAGTWTQAVRAGSAELDYANAVVVDAAGNAFVTGSFYGATLQFGSIPLTNAAPIIGNTPSGDVFVARLDATGTWTQAIQAGGAGTDYASALTSDGVGAVYVGGVVSSQGGQFGQVPVTVPRSTGFISRLNGFPSFPTAVQPAKGAVVGIQVYPNPATSENIALSYVLSNPVSVEVDVLDGLGRTVIATEAKGNQTIGVYTMELPTVGLAPGIYCVRVRRGGVVTYSKLVVEN